MANEEIVVAEEWTEVVVAQEKEEKKEPLADSVARLAEERRLAETESVVVPDSLLKQASPYDVLGELLTKSPAFADYVKKRAAANAPVVRKVPVVKPSNWQVSLGPVYGEAGAVKTLQMTPDRLFRVEKVIATDSAEPSGSGTLIGDIYVGRRSQRPSYGRNWSPTTFFANNSLGRGLLWDTAQPGLNISVTISFTRSCTFYMDLFGKAIV